MSEQPRLLFCCFDVVPAPHGVSRRLTEYLKGLSDKYQVVVLSTKTPDLPHIERYQGARLLRVPVGSGDLQSRIQAFDRAVRRQLESEEYLVGHFFDPFGGYALSEARSQFGFKLVYDAQSFPSQELKYTHPQLESDRRFLSKVRRQELFCLMNADAVITGSDVTREYVLSLGAPQGSLHVLPTPVDLQPYVPEQMGKPDSTPMKLMYLGSQLPYQGLSTLLRAMQLALRQADMHLSLVGPNHPDWHPQLEELVTELKLTGKVDFQAPVAHDDLHKVLATADVGLLPLDDSERNTLQGGAMSKAGEYLAAGRPIIAADFPAVREWVPADAGEFYPPGDFKKLAEVLVRFATSPKLRIELGEHARKGAEAFDASMVRGKLLDLCERLAAKGQKASTTEATTGEITQLRPNAPGKTNETGGIEGGTEPAAAANKAPASVMGVPLREETLDEDQPPVVVGQQLLHGDPPDELLRAAVTEPAQRNQQLPPVVMGKPLDEDSRSVATPTPSQPAPEPTPVVKDRRRKSGRHKAHGPDGAPEHTPITKAPAQSDANPNPITSSRRRPKSTSGNKPGAPPPDDLGSTGKLPDLSAARPEPTPIQPPPVPPSNKGTPAKGSTNVETRGTSGRHAPRASPPTARVTGAAARKSSPGFKSPLAAAPAPAEVQPDLDATVALDMADVEARLAESELPPRATGRQEPVRVPPPVLEPVAAAPKPNGPPVLTEVPAGTRAPVQSVTGKAAPPMLTELPPRAAAASSGALKAAPPVLQPSPAASKATQPLPPPVRVAAPLVDQLLAKAAAAEAQNAPSSRADGAGSGSKRAAALVDVTPQSLPPPPPPSALNDTDEHTHTVEPPVVVEPSVIVPEMTLSGNFPAVVPTAPIPTAPPPPVHKRKSTSGHPNPLVTNRRKSNPGLKSPLAPGVEEEPEEISHDDFDEVDDDSSDETRELHHSEIEDVEHHEPLQSALDVWFALLVHGYCPPQPTDFHRPAPPTTTPGKNQ